MPVARRRTSGRSRGSSRSARPSRSVARDGKGSRLNSLTGTLVAAAVAVSVLGSLMAVTAPGHAAAEAALRFLLFYGGVFALITLTAAVGIGLAATDRIVMSPGRRILAQAVHRTVSLAALAFLIIHVALETAAERSHAVDAVVPFLSRQRTFYIGLGTIASDLILVIMASGFLRPWFARWSRPWVWRAVHASSYLAWLLSIVHGLLGGRTARAYVDWSYAACVAAVVLALAVRLVATPRGRRGAKPAAVSTAVSPAAGRPGGWPALPPGTGSGYQGPSW